MDILRNRTGDLSLDPFQIIDSLSAEIAVIQRDGTIVAVNQAWNDFAVNNNSGASRGLGIGENYIDICARAATSGEDEAAKILWGLQYILEGRKRVVRFEYPCHSPGRERWFTLRITPLV
ncbi:MAG TPA: PAS domain-containing protein, partial [Balneolaceae bacterium]|nr:PAS domain-containing protein [Balneolaceae bacterium]